LLFDTNIVIDILGGVSAARAEYDQNPDRALSVITWIEVMVGVKPDEEAAVLSFLASFTLIPLSPAIAQKAVDVRRSTKQKLPDAIILATAQVENRILLTRNTRDFQPGMPLVRVPYTL